MLLKCNAFNMIVLTVDDIVLPSSYEAKCEYFRTEAQKAGFALVNGDAYSGPLFKVDNPLGVPYSSGTIVGEVFDASFTSIDFEVKSLNKTTTTKSIPSMVSGYVSCNTVATLIKLYAEYFLIERTAKNKGVGLTSVMRAQMASIQARITDISSKSAILALAAEQLVVVDQASVFVSGHAPLVPGLAGYSVVKASETTVDTNLVDLSASIRARTVSGMTAITDAIYDEQIGALGIADWLHPDTWLVKLSKSAGLAWTPDKYTQRMAVTKGSAFYHAHRFVKRFFNGDAQAAYKVGSGAFADLYAKVSRSCDISDVPASLAEYLMSLDILSTSVVDISAALAAIDVLRSDTIEVEVETFTPRGEYLATLAKVHPALWPDQESFTLNGANGIRSSNIAITYASDVDEAYLGLAASIARLTPDDMVVIRDLSTHFAFVLGLFHHASHVGDVKSILNTSLRLKDSVGCLRSLGLEYLMYPGGKYEVR